MITENLTIFLIYRIAVHFKKVLLSCSPLQKKNNENYFVQKQEDYFLILDKNCTFARTRQK